MHPTGDNVFLRFNAANLLQYPKEINPHLEEDVTFGDMHANTMKLLWLLIKENVIEISEDTFNNLWILYNNLWLTSDEYLQPKAKKISSDMRLFIQMLDQIQVKKPLQKKVRLLGDIFADRGANDCLTLGVLHILVKNGVILEIIFSNHDAWLFYLYNKGPVDHRQWLQFNYKEQSAALVGLYYSIKWGVVSQIGLISMFESSVKPFIKPIAYFLSSDKSSITLFMHAPNSFATIMAFAKKMKLTEEEPASAEALANLIDSINNRFQRLDPTSLKKILKIVNSYDGVANQGISERQYLTTILGKEKVGTLSEEERAMGSLLGMLAWNRSVEVPGYPKFVHYVVHGHTGGGNIIFANGINLDDALGKSKNHLIDVPYGVFYNRRLQPRFKKDNC